MLSCWNTRKRMPAYTCGALHGTERESLEAHVGSCPSCAKILSSARLPFDVRAAFPQPDSAQLSRVDLADRVQRAIRREARDAPVRPMAWTLRYVVPACGVAAAMLLVMIYGLLPAVRSGKVPFLSVVLVRPPALPDPATSLAGIGPRELATALGMPDPWQDIAAPQRAPLPRLEATQLRSGTCFALKGRGARLAGNAVLARVKAENDDAATTQRTLGSLCWLTTRITSESLDVRFSDTTCMLGDAAWKGSPVLILSAAHMAEWSLEEDDAVRDYLHAGGMLILDTQGCGPDAAALAATQLARLVPGAGLSTMDAVDAATDAFYAPGCGYQASRIVSSTSGVLALLVDLGQDDRAGSLVQGVNSLVYALSHARPATSA